MSCDMRSVPDQKVGKLSNCISCSISVGHAIDTNVVESLRYWLSCVEIYEILNLNLISPNPIKSKAD